MKYELNEVVTFTLNIGYVGGEQEEEFTLEELGYNPEIHTDIDVFLESEWRMWSAQQIDGGYHFGRE